jgi:hypothetical protein
MARKGTTMTQVHTPVTQFRKAHLAGSIVQTMARCGISPDKSFCSIHGGMIGEIKIDDHVYQGEIETIAEAILNVNNKQDFVQAIESVTIVDDGFGH